MFPHPEPTRHSPLHSACGILVLAVAAGFHGGCAIQRIPPQPLDPAATAAGLGSRSLRDAGLHRFLVQNLGREPATWDFESLSWAAFYFQPSLEVARAQWDIARGALVTASARPNPTISVAPGYNSSATGGVSPWFPAVTMDFLFETGKKRDRRAEIERLNSESARLSILASAWQVRSELRQALIDMAASAMRQNLLLASTAQQQQLELLLQQRVNAGAAAAFEVAPAHAARLKAEIAAADALRQSESARNRAAQAIGIPVSALEGVVLTSLATPPALSPADLAAARRRSLQSRSDILAAFAHYQASQAALELEVAKQFPDFHIGPGYQWDQGENKWSIALTLELPVFNRNQGPIAEAQARRREAAAQLLSVQAQVLAAIDGAALQQSAALARISRLREIADEARRQSVLVEARVAGGGSGQLDLQLARIADNEASLALLDANAEAAVASGQLEDALQVPFAGLDALTAQNASPLSPPSP